MQNQSEKSTTNTDKNQPKKFTKKEVDKIRDNKNLLSTEPVKK